MSDPIVVSNNVRVPAAAIEVRAVRSSGPGGQNVNKVSSKIELRVDLRAIEGFNDRAHARLIQLAGPSRLDADRRLLITSQLTRDQGRNLEDAREKVRDLIARALIEPKKRRATKPTRGSVERRLTGKAVRAKIKAGRRMRDD
jgi:ribosome-associated protein